MKEKNINFFESDNFEPEIMVLQGKKSFWIPSWLDFMFPLTTDEWAPL